jgi:AraC-like DNA-binding protein
MACESPGQSDSLIVTGENLAALIQELWQATNDDLMGLGPHPVPRGAIRVLAFALRSATNLAAALKRFEEFGPAFPGLPQAHISISDDAALLVLDLAGFAQPCDLIADALLAVTHRTICWAIGRPVRLHRVELPHPLPRGLTDYEQIFEAPVRFSASRAALVFDRTVLDEPVLREEHEVETFLADAPSRLFSRSSYYISHADRVRHIIEESTGLTCTADSIAALTGMSRQTLRRRLRDENTSLTSIKDDVRRQVAMTSLSKGEETISALSQRLGFSETSAFTRAFRRWTGVAPTHYRHGPTAAGRSHAHWHTPRELYV